MSLRPRRPGPILALVCLLMAAGGRAQAGARPLDACYKAAANRIGVGECLERRLDRADAAREAVATALQEQVSALDRATGGGGVAEAFEESERAFREYLDRHCAWVGAMAGAGTGAGDLVKDCAIRLTEQHTLELKAQLPSPRKAPLPATAGSAAATAITGGEWRLTGAQRDGKALHLPADPPVTLAVDANGMVAGKGWINRYFARVATEEPGRLVWTGPIGSTRMSGAADLMEAEDTYLLLLGRTDRWRVEAGALVLESADGAARLRFRR